MASSRSAANDLPSQPSISSGVVVADDGHELLLRLRLLHPFHRVVVDVLLVVAQPVEELTQHLVLVDGGGG